MKNFIFFIKSPPNVYFFNKMYISVFRGKILYFLAKTKKVKNLFQGSLLFI